MGGQRKIKFPVKDGAIARSILATFPDATAQLTVGKSADEDSYALTLPRTDEKELLTMLSGMAAEKGASDGREEA